VAFWSVAGSSNDSLLAELSAGSLDLDGEISKDSLSWILIGCSGVFGAKLDVIVSEELFELPKVFLTASEPGFAFAVGHGSVNSTNTSCGILDISR